MESLLFHKTAHLLCFLLHFENEETYKTLIYETIMKVLSGENGDLAPNKRSIVKSTDFIFVPP